MGVSMIPVAKAEDDAAEDYAKRVERYNLELNPDKHKTLASWCERHYPEKYEYHLIAYNQFKFSELETELSVNPRASELLEMLEEAKDLGLDDKHREYLERWGTLVYSEHAKRLKPGDVKMMKQLLTWCIDHEIDFIDPAQQLAQRITEEDPEYSPARQALGQVNIDGKWQSLDEAFAGIDLKDADERLAMHRKLAESAETTETDYPSNPVRGMQRIGGSYLTSTAASQGQAKYFLTVNGYSKSKPCPLVISLHGGGSGGFEKAREYAAIAAKEWNRTSLKGGCIAIAPIARQHLTNSWGTLSNFEDLIDAIEETTERFNIDRKRIYITGQSMGGGGTTLYYFCFPELAAASCARAGYYFSRPEVTNTLNKPIMIIHGEKDEAFRTNSRDEVVKQIEDGNGDLTHVSLPDIDHFIPTSEVLARAIPFFEEHESDVAPDFRLIRATARAWFGSQASGGGRPKATSGDRQTGHALNLPFKKWLETVEFRKAGGPRFVVYGRELQIGPSIRHKIKIDEETQTITWEKSDGTASIVVDDDRNGATWTTASADLVAPLSVHNRTP